MPRTTAPEAVPSDRGNTGRIGQQHPKVGGTTQTPIFTSRLSEHSCPDAITSHSPQTRLRAGAPHLITRRGIRLTADGRVSGTSRPSQGRPPANTVTSCDSDADCTKPLTETLSIGTAAATASDPARRVRVPNRRLERARRHQVPTCSVGGPGAVATATSASWDDILPPVPDDTWRAKQPRVARAVAVKDGSATTGSAGGSGPVRRGSSRSSPRRTVCRSRPATSPATTRATPPPLTPAATGRYSTRFSASRSGRPERRSARPRRRP